MAEVRVLNYVELVGFGKTLPIGDLNTPVTISLDNSAPKYIQQRFALPAGGGVATELLKLGTAAGDDLPSFKYLRLVPSVTTFVCFKGTADADTSVIAIDANEVFQLTSDDTKDDGADPTTRLTDATSNDIKYVYAYSASAGYIDVLAAF